MNIGRKEKIEWAVTGALILVFLIIVLSRGHGRASGGRKTAGAPAVPRESAGSKGAQEGLFLSLQKRSAQLSLKRDPFYGTQIGGSAGCAGRTGIALSGIFWDPDNPRAIINGRIICTGDAVDDYTVKEIARDRVLLGNGDKEIELKLER